MSCCKKIKYLRRKAIFRMKYFLEFIKIRKNTIGFPNQIVKSRIYNSGILEETLRVFLITKSKLNFYFNCIVFCFFLFFINSCTTKKNTLMHRGWHNMNARYNGYFYSGEYMKESVKKVEKANKDDFIKILPVFIYPDNKTAKSYYGDFDKTIKKSSTCIHRHAIINPRTKEEIPNACHWIDENYMLIGKGHFYKRDFFSALEMFEYVSKKYPNPEAKYAGMLWLVRAYNEIGSFTKSEMIIDELRNAKDFPKEKAFQLDFAAVWADFYIKKEDYHGAITLLKRAITLTKKKAIKARYNFILAQLYEKIEDNVNALTYYSMVPALHPTYEMEFAAQIKRGKLFDSNLGDSKIIKRQLMKMLRDDKNIEYRDQIYYALAEIADAEKDTPLAINYLEKSIRASVSNNTQKAVSFLKRADIYFEKINYEFAETNYDSAMMFLPKDYPNYSFIETKKKSLTLLVVNLKIIALEDSLQGIGKMSEKERNTAIDKLISKVEEEEKEAEELRLENLKNPQLVNQNQNAPALDQAGNSNAWYFYNPSTVNFGVGEFNKKWGARKLEDNWRRSDKEQVSTSLIDESINPVDSVEKKENSITEISSSKDKKDRNFYLKKIPISSEELVKSNSKIVEAYYTIGSIYKEQLLNNTKSIQAIEELLKRFPENKYKLPCYYQLYRSYLAIDNIPKSDYYKNLLLNDYPESEYSKIIKNPEYGKIVMASKSQVENFYTQTYQLYSEGKYSAALINCFKADTVYYKNYLMPQFDFVKALSIGRTQDISAFERALTQVTMRYPKEPVKEKAQEILDLIRAQKIDPTSFVDTTKKLAKPIVLDTIQQNPKFTFKEAGEYYWLVIVENGKGDINKFKTNLSDLNEESFSSTELAIASIFLDSSHQLVSVKSFDGKTMAMAYYNFFKENKTTFLGLEAGTFSYFIISAENYTVFYKDKNIDEYQQFFLKNFK